MYSKVYRVKVNFLLKTEDNEEDALAYSIFDITLAATSLTILSITYVKIEIVILTILRVIYLFHVFFLVFFFF